MIAWLRGDVINKSGNYYFKDYSLLGNDIPITNYDFVGNEWPSGSTATISLPATQNYLNADINNFWFNTGTPNNISWNDLWLYTGTTTFYASTYDENVISDIIIYDTPPTQSSIDYLSIYLRLWFFHTGVFNDYGFSYDTKEML